ncbi:MAG: heavy metal translocating P-type ATPase [Lachnospiraceae bacterium]|nr:heavy metal translocating P-type ATPase [Lachnospiraceae bacterium]
MTKKIKKMIIRIAIGAVLLAAGVLCTHFLGKWESAAKYAEWVGLAIYIAAYLVIGFDIVKNAFVNIAHGRVFDENFLMMIATVGAFACREYVEAVAVMLFYQIGECFQSYAVNKSRKSIRALMSIRPDFARVVRDGAEVEVDPSEVNIGETIIIKPGERVPLDGTIIEGASSIDTAAITGESMPRDVAAGDMVVSGCVNASGVIKVNTTSNFAESTVSKVLTLVEEASSKKAKSEQFITVFARYYTPIVVISAVLLAIVGTLVTGDFRTWIYRAMTFLLISCPCALVISIPLSFFGGIGGAGRKGILIKGGNYMDTLSKVNTLVLDKTGTITKGNFALGEIEPSSFMKKEYGDGAEDELVRIAALAESYSTHPIALSIIARYGREINKSAVSEIKEIAGKGVSAEIEGKNISVGNKKLMLDVVEGADILELDSCSNVIAGGTLVYVAIGGRYAGHMHIVDEIKDNAAEALSLCRKAGINDIVMLTGDNEKTAKAVAGSVSIDRFYANLNPLDKVTSIETIMAEEPGRVVAFVGDGINDAPVLSRADIGIAMGAMGSDASIEAADVVIMTDDLAKLSEAKRIALKTLRIVKENIVFALGIKLLILVLAAFGIANMWAAIFADVGVAFLAILSAMRALKA